MIPRTVIENKFTELRNSAEQMLERINGMPAGPERELAMLEYQCTARVINNVRNDLTRDSRMDTVQNLAILSYIQEAKRAGVTPSVDDIRENGLALAEDPKFSRVIATHEDNDSKYVILNTLFDGPKSEHLAGWKNECTREAEDYEAEFSRFADQIPEERRETVKNRYMRMGEFNEYIKAFDYTLKKRLRNFLTTHPTPPSSRNTKTPWQCRII